MSSFHQHLRTLTAPSLRKGQWRPDSYNPERIPLKVGAFGQRGSPDPVTTFPLPPTHFPGFLRLGLLPRHPTATLPAAAPTSCLSLKLTHRRHVPPCFLPHPNRVPLHATRPRDRPSQGPGRGREGGGRSGEDCCFPIGRRAAAMRATRAFPGILGVAADRALPPWAEVGDVREFISDLLALQHLLELPLDSLHRDVGHVSARS